MTSSLSSSHSHGSESRRNRGTPWRVFLFGIAVGFALHSVSDRYDNCYSEKQENLVRKQVSLQTEATLQAKAPLSSSQTASTAHTTTFGCKNDLYTKGHWIRASRQNTTTQQQSSSSSLSPSLSYQWQVDDPQQCRLEAWDHDSFCRAVQGRSILIVGDSINLQWFEFMSHLFNDGHGNELPIEVHQYQILTNKRHAVHCSMRLCRDGYDNNTFSRLTFLRNDYLQVEQVLEEHTKKAAINIPWFHLIPQHDVLILNTGAHTRRPVDHYRQGLQQVKAALFENQQQQQPSLVLWRTTPRGHPGCTATETPIVDTNSSEWKRFYDPQSTAFTTYNYNRILEYNNVLRKTFADVATVLDVAPLTELRPDGHRDPPKDCLHYNTMDVYFEWTRLLLNALNDNL